MMRIISDYTVYERINDVVNTGNNAEDILSIMEESCSTVTPNAVIL